MQIEALRIHPQYDHTSLLAYDYAIIRTAQEIIFSPTVNAACLPSFTDLTTTDGKPMTISGWGFMENDGYYYQLETDHLNVAMVQGFSSEECCNIWYSEYLTPGKASLHC